MEKMLATFRSWKSEGEILNTCNQYNGETDFFDWSFELNGKQLPASGNSLMNCMYLIALDAMEKLRKIAGIAGNGHSEEITRMREAVIRRFHMPREKVLIDAENSIMDEEQLERLGVRVGKKANFRSSRVVHALALLAGAEQAIPEQGVLQNVLLDDSFFPPELFYSSFILLAMKKCGFHSEALAYIRKYWGPIVDSGSPTLWENGVYFPGKAGFGGSASLCHGFSTSPADFLQTVILGISPVEPGFTVFRFAPDPCDLHFASGSVMTPHGTIRASWNLNDHSIEAELLIPDGCSALTPAGEYGSGRHELTWQI